MAKRVNETDFDATLREIYGDRPSRHQVYELSNVYRMEHGEDVRRVLHRARRGDTTRVCVTGGIRDRFKAFVGGR